jgi:hypothetical protein
MRSGRGCAFFRISPVRSLVQVDLRRNPHTVCSIWFVLRAEDGWGTVVLGRRSTARGGIRGQSLPVRRGDCLICSKYHGRMRKDSGQQTKIDSRVQLKLPDRSETHVEASGEVTLTSASSTTEPPKRVMIGTPRIYLPFSASHPA